MVKIAFLIHGKYPDRNNTIAEAERLFGDGYEVSCRVTQGPGQFEPYAFEAVKQGFTHVICVGGDGSLNETINGIMRAKSEGSREPAGSGKIYTGLLPAGTGNDFAKTLGIGHSLTTLRQWVEAGSYKTIDIGLAELTSVDGQKIKRYFINIADVGIGGFISQRIAGSSKILGAIITYQSAIIRALLSYKNQPVTVVTDTFSYEGRVMNFVIANGKYFGAGLGIAPDALPDDGQFSTVAIGDISLWDYIKNLGKVRKCEKLNHPGLQYSHARNISVNTPSGPIPVDMDGEFAGYSPLKISIQPGAIHFICPA